MRLTKSGKPSRWDVPPLPSPCIEEEADNAQWEETDKAHTQWNETDKASTQRKETDKAPTQWVETDKIPSQYKQIDKTPTQWKKTEKAPTQCKETDKASTQWEETERASTQWEEAAKVSTQWEETDKGSTQTNNTPAQEAEGPLQKRLLGLSGSLGKDDPLQLVQEITQLTEELRSLTSALPALSEDTSAALPPIPTAESPDVTASSSTAKTPTSPPKVPQPVKIKGNKKRHRSEKVSHKSLTTQLQTVDFAGEDSSPQYFASSGLAENAWQPQILDKMLEEMAVKISPRKVRHGKAPAKPERYEPTQHLTSEEPEPVKSVSEKRIIRVKAKPAASKKVPDKREVKRKSKSYVSEYESRRLVKVKSAAKSSKATYDKDTRDYEKEAPWGSEKTLDESSQASAPKQNSSSRIYPEDLPEKPCHSREREKSPEEDTLVNSLAHTSIQPVRDFDFSQFFPHSRSEEQYFIDSLAQKCSKIQLDRGSTVNPQSASGGTAQHEETDRAYQQDSEHEEYPLGHSAFQTAVENKEYPLADEEIPIADASFQASNVQYEEYPLEDTTFQTDVGHHRAERAPGMDGPEKGTSAKLYSTAYVDAALSGQGVYPTDQVIGNPRRFAANKDFAPPQHGGGTHQMEPVVSNQGGFIPGQPDDRTRGESRATDVKKSPPAPPASLNQKLEGTAISRQARTALPAVKKARKGSVTNMNERDKLKALFSVRKKKTGLTRMDSSGSSETQLSKSPNKASKVGLMPTETSSNAEDCSFTQKSLQASLSSAKQNVQAGKDTRNSCNLAVSNMKETVIAQNDGERSFSQPVLNTKQTRTAGNGIQKSPVNTGNAEQSYSPPVQSMEYDFSDDLDQSSNNAKYIDDDDILREIDSCLETSTSDVDTANVAAEAFQTIKDRLIGSEDLTWKSSEPSSIPSSSQSCIIVEQDPSGNTEINISVAVSADDAKNTDVRAGGYASSHREGNLDRPIAGQLKDGMDTDDDSECVTTCFDLRLPRKQALEIHVKPVLQGVDELGNSIEVEVSTDAGSVTGNTSISSAETHTPIPRRIACSASTSPGIVTQSAGQSSRETCPAESRRIAFSKSTVAVIVERKTDREECSESDEVHQNNELSTADPVLGPEKLPASFSRSQTLHSDAHTMPDSPETRTPQDTPMDTEEESEELYGRELNRIAGDHDNSSAVGDWLAQGREELQEGRHEKTECSTRNKNQMERNPAQSQKKFTVGFPMEEPGLEEPQMSADVGVPAAKLKQKEQTTAQVQQRKEVFISVQAESHSNGEQCDSDTADVEACMETELAKSRDVRTNSSHGGEKPSGSTDVESHMEMEAPFLCGSATVSGTMSLTTTNTTPADTLELGSSLCLDLDENTSPVSDDSDDSLSDGPDFVSSVARSPLPLSAVNTNVLAQGERTTQAGKQMPTSTADERPMLFSLDSLLTDTKNAEAEEQEILVMQTELKRELMSSKGIGIASEGEDDTEEAEDEGFTDEQKDTLLKLRLEEGQIRDVHPGEAVLADHAYGQLFTENLLPADCGVTSVPHNPLGQLLSNYQPEMLMDILSSDIISLAYNSLPCKEQVQRWLLFLLSCHSNATVVQKCGDQLLQVLQWQMEDVLDGNQRHTWAPNILDVLRVFVNWGAKKDSLVFEAVGTSQLGEVMPLHENREQMQLPAGNQRNVEPVLKLLSCLVQARPSYSTEELNQLLVMVCKVSLDQSLVRECLLSELQVCMASILDCYEASQWTTAVPWLCGALGGLSNHHHNQLYVTQLFSPTCMRGGYLQQRLAFFFLHTACNHCKPTDQQLRDFKMQDLCELIAGLRPLLQSDNYQLSSLIHLLDLSVGPAVQHITQRKQLCRLLESVRLIVSEIRDSVQRLDCTKVKGMLLHLCLKWDLSVKASNTKQRKIFSCLVSRPVPVEKLEDRGQLCNEEEGTDDLAFPNSDDEGEIEGGGGKRLKTEGDWIERESQKTQKDDGDYGETETATQGPSSKGDTS